MKFKRIIVGLLCSSLVLLNTFTVGATEISNGNLVDNTTQTEIPVTATIKSTFTVSLPSNLQLTSDGGPYTYSTTVGVRGDISVDSAVEVSPNADVTLYDVTNRPEGTDSYDGYEHKEPIIAEVRQSETMWPYSILSSGVSSGNFAYASDSQCYNTNLTISSSDLSAGDWEGTLTYDISLVKYQPAGLYDANDNLLVTWEDSGIDVSRDYTSSNYNTEKTSLKYVLTHNYKEATKVVIPDSVTRIGQYAFRDCAGLTSISIPDSVTGIGTEAFRNCLGLTSVTIPDSVTSIGRYAFNSCSGLTSVTIPNSVTSISGDTFYYCTGLTSITIPDSVTSIDSDAFYRCTGLTSVTIPDSVTKIGANAFYGCTSLTSVTIPDSVTSIGGSAFYNVPHIYYNGSATGSPWGAKAIN